MVKWWRARKLSSRCQAQEGDGEVVVVVAVVAVVVVVGEELGIV